jgi:5-methylcytosine-specific restriction endonuclease McrA
MTNEELEIRFSRLVKSERKITAEVLCLIREAESRRHYLERGFSNIFDWLTRGHGYSAPAANRRILAARMTTTFPQAQEKILSGSLNLSTLAQLQSALRRQEHRYGEVPLSLKNELFEKIEGKTVDEVESILMTAFPDTLKKEVLRSVNGTDARLSLNLPKETVGALSRARALLSHAIPNPSWSDVITYLINYYLKKNDPAQNKSDTVNHRVKLRARGQCEFRAPSGRRCTSRYQLEIDHIIPRALGGTSNEGNLRVLCKQHNLYEAERILGTKVMAPYSSLSGTGEKE